MGQPKPNCWLVRILQSRNPLTGENELLEGCLSEWPMEFRFNPAYIIHRSGFALAGAQLRYAVRGRLETTDWSGRLACIC